MVRPEGPIKDLQLFMANSKHIKHQEISSPKCKRPGSEVRFVSNPTQILEKHRLFGPGEVGEVLGFGPQIEAVWSFVV